MMNFARIFITLLIYEDMHLFSSLFINRYQESVYSVSIIRFRAVIEWEIICLSIFLVPPRSRSSSSLLLSLCLLF